MDPTSPDGQNTLPGIEPKPAWEPWLDQLPWRDHEGLVVDREERRFWLRAAWPTIEAEAYATGKKGDALTKELRSNLFRYFKVYLRGERRYRDPVERRRMRARAKLSEARLAEDDVPDELLSDAEREDGGL